MLRRLVRGDQIRSTGEERVIMVRTLFVLAVALMSTSAMPGTSLAAADLEKGAKAYYFCYNCHSLEPGVHLTGPSLAGLWGKQAGSIADFGRYSPALKAAVFTWNETTLDAWFENSQALVPGNTMILRAMEHAGVRSNLVAFLRIAMGPDGAAEVVARGLLPKDYAVGRVPRNLTEADPGQMVTAVRHCGDAYWVTTADGKEVLFWERNLHFKTDTGKRGPKPGQPVLVDIGSVGDRASIVFADPAELAGALAGPC